jgi:tRNA-dihydrouridine synthase C
MSSLSQLSNASNQIWLAPMEGVVDPVVRNLWTKLGGIDICVTEFIRVTDRAVSEDVFYKYCPELQTGGKTESGVPVLVQLLGGKTEPMAASAKRAAELGAPGIDLNFGCPAKTVNRHDGGATLLKDPRRIFDMVSAVRAAVPKNLTVSAKVRLGFSDKSLFLEIAQAAQEAGSSWIVVHARTRDEGYRPPAHWEYIGRIREALKIPVIANGEIWTIEDYHRAREISGCEHVMIGRGLMSRPDLALEIKRGLRQFNRQSQLRFIEEFALASHAYRGENYSVGRMKQILKSFAKAEPTAAELFENIKRFDTLNEILTVTRNA